MKIFTLETKGCHPVETGFSAKSPVDLTNIYIAYLLATFQLNKTLKDVYHAYNVKLLLVQKFAKVHQQSSGEFFTVFILAQWMRDTPTTLLPVGGHAPHANPRNDTEWWSKEASLCNNGLVFLCMETFTCNYECIKTATMGEKVASWTKGFCTSDLDLENFGASLTGSWVRGIMYSNRLIWIWSNYFKRQIEWQTVENHLLHSFILLGSRSVCEIREYFLLFGSC